MDEGKIIQQTIYPVNPHENPSRIRHKLFEQQCKSLLQVVYWLSKERILIDNNKTFVKNANFREFEYSPNLDFVDAIDLKVPLPFVESI
jgi:phosphoribosylglycinamide formyltransferase 1